MTDTLAGAGEMARRCRDFAWSDTPLGAFECWPVNLRAVAMTMLETPLPMALWWGTDLLQVYNDAYAQLLGEQHGVALARPAADTWRDARSALGRSAEPVLRGERATSTACFQFSTERCRDLGKTCVMFAFSPVRDDSGAICAVLAICPAPAQREVASADRVTRVLLVNDDVPTRESIRSILEMQHWEVDAVAEVGEAVVAACSHPPDLIVACVTAPTSENLSSLRKLQFAAAPRSVRVLLLSECAGDESRVAAMVAGADDCLAIPFSERELVARVRTHLEIAHLHYDLRTQQEGLYALIMQSPVPTSVIRGDDLVIEIANERMLTMVNRRDIVGMKYVDVFPQVELDGYDELLREVMHSGKPLQGEQVLARFDRNRDGRFEDSYWSFTWTPLADADGRHDRVMVAAIDVTHDLVLRRKLKESEEGLRRLVDQVSAGTAQTSLTGRFTHVSERFCELVGRPERLLLRRKMQDITHPDDRAPIDAWFLRLVERGSPRVVETRCVKPDGTIAWLQTSLSRLHDRDCRIIGVNAVCVDVTHRKLAECCLQAADRRFLTLVEMSTHVIWTTDANANMCTEQPGWSRFTGQSRAEYSGRGWLDAIHPDDRAALGEYIERSRVYGEPFKLEHRVRRRDGQFRSCVAQGAPIRNDDGTIFEWTGTHTDVTEQRALEQQLSLSHAQAAVARRGTSGRPDVVERFEVLTKSLGRDLRDPLTAIIKAAQVLERRTDFGKIANPVNRILASVGQVQHVVAQLLEFVDANFVRYRVTPAPPKH
jgi:PAS domain S-box-containing protein